VAKLTSTATCSGGAGTSPMNTVSSRNTRVEPSSARAPDLVDSIVGEAQPCGAIPTDLGPVKVNAAQTRADLYGHVKIRAPRRLAYPRWDYLNPEAEHLLDWFHVTMRLTLMGQLAKSLRSRENPKLAVELAEELPRLKWYLWHGNVFLALQTITYLQLDVDNEDPRPEQQKLSKAVAEFGGYIRANGAWIPNHGERCRSGEAISSAFVESAVNQVVSKRWLKSSRCAGHPEGLTCSSRSAPAS
jgi:hypothetical protein